MTNNATEEIDLFELVDDLKQGWFWWVGSLVAFAVLALFYVYLASPVYQVTTEIKEVTDAELLQINQPKLKAVFFKTAAGPNKNDVFLSSKDAFDRPRSVLRSSNALKLYFEHLIASDDGKIKAAIAKASLTQEQNFLRFSESFTFTDPGAKEIDRYLTIKFEWTDVETAADILNGYVDFAMLLQQQAKDMIDEMIAWQLAQWQLEVDELRLKYTSKKQLRLLELQEAQEIASAISQRQSVYSADRLAIGVEPPLYMMG